jgi:hypothetical protein
MSSILTRTHFKLNMSVYIPQEILDKIIGYAAADTSYGYLVTRKFCSRISFVSRTFHQIVLPYKFRSLAFEFHNREGFNFTTLIPIPKFCEAINAGDAHALSLAPLVRELHLLYWSGKDGFFNDLVAVQFEKILNVVISFSNLTKLSMKKCVTSPTIMEQLGKLVQLQSLHTWRCHDEDYGDKVSYSALSNLQSLHTLECNEDRGHHFKRHLACIPMKNLRVLKGDDSEVITALSTFDPPVQLKELWLTRDYRVNYSLLWSYLARVTSLTHLSIAYLELSDGPPPLYSLLSRLHYLRIHVAFAPRFADQPLKELRIDTDSKPDEAMVEVRRHWQGTVFPHVEYLETDRTYKEMDKIPFEFWKEFLLNVKKVCTDPYRDPFT